MLIKRLPITINDVTTIFVPEEELKASDVNVERLESEQRELLTTVRQLEKALAGQAHGSARREMWLQKKCAFAGELLGRTFCYLPEGSKIESDVATYLSTEPADQEGGE